MKRTILICIFRYHRYIHVAISNFDQFFRYNIEYIKKRRRNSQRDFYTWQSMHRQLSVNEQVRPRISAASLYSSALDFRCLGGVAGALTVPDSLLPLFSLEEDSRDKEEVDVDPLRRLSLVSNARPAGEANNCNMSISCNHTLNPPF